MKKETKDVSEEVAVVTATLPLETLNEVLGYLANKPYAEVAQLVAKVQNEVKVNN